jgi:hypothetical protein
VAGAVALGVALWTAPVVDHLTVEPSNLSLLVDHFSEPTEATAGPAKAVELVLLHLDPVRFLGGRDATTGSSGSPPTEIVEGSVIPGVVVGLLWLAAVVAAVRLRHRELVRLHVVVAAGLVLATLSISRIFGQLWPYLMVWAWCTTGLLVLPHGSDPPFVADSKAGPLPQIDVPVRDHYAEFVDVVLGGGKARCSANFDYAGPVTESVLIGNVAAHFPGETLAFDAKALSFPQKKDANQYLTRDYRKGFGMKPHG